jgi:hypothetical protein
VTFFVFETMPYIVDQGMKVQTHGVPVPIKLTVPLESLPSGDAGIQVNKDRPVKT